MRALAFIAALVACAAATFFSYNEAALLLDPYNVVWRAPERPRAAWAVEQFRGAKIHHLAAHRDAYDTLILSDSRGSANKTSKVARASGLRLFNLSTSEDSPVGFVPKVRWAIDNMKLRAAILILSPMQFQATPQPDLLLFHEHPAVSGESWLSYYWTFSNLPYATFLTSARYYVRRALGLPVDRTPVITSGFHVESGDTNIWGRDYDDFEPSAADRAVFDAQVKNDAPGVIRFRHSSLAVEEMAGLRTRFAQPLRQAQIDSFAETIALLRSRDVAAHCLMAPLPLSTVRLIPQDLYFKWMQIVLEHCGSAWDFSIPTAVTADNYNYWDIGHYLPHVAHAMLIRVLCGEGDPEFGRRLNAGDDLARYRQEWLAAAEAADGAREEQAK